MARVSLGRLSGVSSPLLSWRLRQFARVLRSRCGRAECVALLLVLLCLAASILIFDSERIRQSLLVSLADAGTPQEAAEKAAQETPVAFTLPHRKAVPTVIGDIVERAERHGLAAIQGDYPVGELATATGDRQNIMLNLAGHPEAVDAFLSGLFAEYRSLSLQEGMFERDAEGQLQARLGLALYLNGDAGDRSPVLLPRAADAGSLQALFANGTPAPSPPGSESDEVAENSAPVEAPPDEPPPLPFRVIGRYREPAGTVVFLENGEKNLLARPGSILLDQYKVESIGESEMNMRYLPLNRMQQLKIGDPW